MTSPDRARRSAKVTPIYVIAGFLGSGKTTLLKRVLAHQLDRGHQASGSNERVWGSRCGRDVAP